MRASRGPGRAPRSDSPVRHYPRPRLEHQAARRSPPAGWGRAETSAASAVCKESAADRLPWPFCNKPSSQVQNKLADRPRRPDTPRHRIPPSNRPTISGIRSRERNRVPGRHGSCRASSHNDLACGADSRSRRRRPRSGPSRSIAQGHPLWLLSQRRGLREECVILPLSIDTHGVARHKIHKVDAECLNHHDRSLSRQIAAVVFAANELLSSRNSRLSPQFVLVLVLVLVTVVVLEGDAVEYEYEHHCAKHAQEWFLVGKKSIDVSRDEMHRAFSGKALETAIPCLRQVYPPGFATICSMRRSEHDPGRPRLRSGFLPARASCLETTTSARFAGLRTGRTGLPARAASRRRWARRATRPPNR